MKADANRQSCARVQKMATRANTRNKRCVHQKYSIEFMERFRVIEHQVCTCCSRVLSLSIVVSHCDSTI